MALGKLTFLCLNTACIGVLGLLIVTMLLRANGGGSGSRVAGETRENRFRYGSSYLFRQDHPYVEWMKSEVPYSRSRVEEEPEREVTYEP
jgi:hypothetical protein